MDEAMRQAAQRLMNAAPGLLIPWDLIDAGKDSRGWRPPESVRDDRGVRWLRNPHANGIRRWFYLPDLADPATLGVVLALVRQAWDRPDIYIRSNKRGAVWTPDCVGTPDPLIQIEAPSEAEAMVAALEAARG